MDNDMNKMKKNEKGLVLSLVAIMVVVLLFTGLGLLKLGSNARIKAAVATSGISATAAADAGMTQARRLMNKKLVDELVWDNYTLPSETDTPLANANASYTFNVSGDPCGFTVTSTGRSGGSTYTVNSALTVGSLFSGISVEDTINLKYGATLGTIPAGGELGLRTNSAATDSIILKSGVVIPGDVVVGPGGDLDDVINSKQSTVIQGHSYPAQEEIIFPPVVVPSALDSLSTTSYTYTPGVPITGSVKLDSISIPGSGIQEFDGECKVYVLGDITLDNAAGVTITAGSSLTLYLAGNMAGMNSTGVTNATDDSTKFTLYGLDTCTLINLKNNVDLYGSVYAPNADILIGNWGDLYGAFIGNSFEMRNAGSFYFDSALANSGIDELAAFFKVQRWWED